MTPWFIIFGLAMIAAVTLTVLVKDVEGDCALILIGGQSYWVCV